MKFTWDIVKNDRYETEHLFVGTQTKEIATISKDRDICGHLCYLGFINLPSLGGRIVDDSKDALKNEIIGKVVAWFNQANN